jgi:hypothetical protein
MRAGRKFRESNREREDSNQLIEVFTRPIEFEFPAGDPRRETSPHQAITCQIAAEKNLGQM